MLDWIYYYYRQLRALPRFVFRLFLRTNEYQVVNEQRKNFAGFLDFNPSSAPVILVHSVSLLEFNHFQEVLRRVQTRYPQATFLITLRSLLGLGAAVPDLEQNHQFCYAPIDLGWFVTRFLDRAQPDLVVMTETSYWPVLFHKCQQREIPVTMFNGQTSFALAESYCVRNSLLRSTVSQLTFVGAVNDHEKRNFIDQGLPVERCKVVGESRLSTGVTDKHRELAESFISTIRSDNQSIVIFASVELEEFDLIEKSLGLIRESKTNCLFLFVPRHPNFTRHFHESLSAGFNVNLRSEISEDKTNSEIIICNSLGELVWLYGAADIAVVCGSFTNLGGHNIMEPAAWGLPVISGPDLAAHAETKEALLNEGGLLIAHSSEELAERVCDLMQNPNRRDLMSKAAKRTTAAFSETPEKMAAEIEKLIR